jgi:hypothetical protein
MECGSLNLLEPSGPVKACNGIALPLPGKLVQKMTERFSRNNKHFTQTEELAMGTPTSEIFSEVLPTAP